MTTEELGKGLIEKHLESLIKNYEEVWLGYKKQLENVRRFLKEPKPKSQLSISEGDSFIRFKSNIDEDALNSFFFIYEIGEIFPNIRWRHLIGTTQGLSYVLLTKPIFYLPAFSFSLDHLTTLIYWGESIPFLSTLNLRDIKLNNFLLKVNKPSSVEVSAANLVWPKSGYHFINKELEELAKKYVFNSLMPPLFDNLGQIWMESPFVLIGDKTVNFLTIHKTFCNVDLNAAKIFKERGIINTKATIIDRNFIPRRIPIDIPEEYFDEFKKEYPYEVLFVKVMKFRYDPTSNEQKPYLRYTIYPFTSTSIFGNENYGWLLSLISIVLRERYLRSDNPFKLTITPEDLKWYLNKIVSTLNIKVDRQLGLKLIENTNGLLALAFALGVYTSEDSSPSYIHPALIERFPFNFEDQFEKNDLIRFQKVVSMYSQEAGSLNKPNRVFSLQKLFEKEFNYSINFKTAYQLESSLYNLVNVYIPLSKTLNLTLM